MLGTKIITITATITMTMAKNITTSINVFTTMATTMTKKHDYDYNMVAQIRKIKQKFNLRSFFQK